jgi:hypothetical protein
MAAMARTNERIWAERVAEWRASGLSSEAFSRGREFTGGGLRHWAYLLRRRRARPAPSVEKAPPMKSAAVRLARVTVAAPPVAAVAAPATAGSGVVLEVGAVRLLLSPRFDRETLAAALAVLADEGAR